MRSTAVQGAGKAVEVYPWLLLLFLLYKFLVQGPIGHGAWQLDEGDAIAQRYVVGDELAERVDLEVSLVM